MHSPRRTKMITTVLTFWVNSRNREIVYFYHVLQQFKVEYLTLYNVEVNA